MSCDLYLVLHLPKTAGSTLFANFCAGFARDELLLMSPRVTDWQRPTIASAIDNQLKNKSPRTRCVFGHWAYVGIHRRVQPEARPRYITFLREPVERCVSWYGFVQSRPDNPFHAALALHNWSLGQWLEHGEILELHNGQVRRLLFEGTNDILLEPRLDRDHLEAAKERLREFWFVGLTETFDFDSSCLYGRLNFWRFHPSRVVNATSSKPRASPEERAALAKANELDLELVAFARALRADWLREHAAQVRLTRRKVRLLKQFNRSVSPLKQVKRRLFAARPADEKASEK